MKKKSERQNSNGEHAQQMANSTEYGRYQSSLTSNHFECWWSICTKMETVRVHQKTRPNYMLCTGNPP